MKKGIKMEGLEAGGPDAVDDAFTYTCKAFELAEGGATVFEVEEYLLLDGFVKLLEGATVGGACFCFYHQHDLVVGGAAA